MKTFDEAAVIAFNEVYDSFMLNVRDLSTDIKSNREVQGFITELTGATMKDLSVRSVRSSLLAAFHMGINVGMEMEKRTEFISAAKPCDNKGEA
jgi:hypothetical protein